MTQNKNPTPDESFLELVIIGLGLLALFFIGFKPAWDLFR